jgi:C-terminal processing protease CtpA/Prc
LSLYEDQGRRVAGLVTERWRQGALDSAIEPAAFAAAIEQLLQAETHDRHLLVRYGSPSELLKRAPMMVGPSIGKTEMLAGNIGYVEVRNFMSAGEGNAKYREQIDDAIASVQNASVLVFDLRQAPGGGLASVEYLASYLFAKPTHLLNRIPRPPGEVVETWTQTEVRGTRLPDVPVFILTSRETFSAAEAFAFALKQAGRATIIGETTGGGGHSGGPGAFRTLPHGFGMFVALSRSVDPRTGKGWQTEGVHPDREVSADRALEAALELARKR